MLWLWLFISGLILVIVLLLIKIHLLRKSAKEIECSFAEKLITVHRFVFPEQGKNRKMKSGKLFMIRFITGKRI